MHHSFRCNKRSFFSNRDGIPVPYNVNLPPQQRTGRAQWHNDSCQGSRIELSATTRRRLLAVKKRLLLSRNSLFFILPCT